MCEPVFLESKPMKQPSKKFVSRRELSERWGISPMSLKRMQKSGKLTAYHIGRDCRYSLEQIEAIEQAAVAA
jgi:hypothetical protein